MAEGHQSSPRRGLTVTSSSDPRVFDLLQKFRSEDVTGRSGKDLVSDPFRGGALEQNRLGACATLQFGTVVYSVPYLNWHKVQLGPGQGSIGCCGLYESCFIATGARSIAPYPPNSPVIVWVPPGLTWGIILGAIPAIQDDPSLAISDWLSQASGVGFHREQAYLYPIQNLAKEGGVLDFSGGRPLDATGLEWGRITETGIGLMIDPFQAFLRVNEACGLFLNYFDSHCRLAGLALNIQSSFSDRAYRDDEGECQMEYGEAVYPWEAMGVYASGTQVHDEHDDAQVIGSLLKGKLDLKDGEDDLQAFHRYREYGGYLGQGRIRMMVLPPRFTGKRLASDPAASGGNTSVTPEPDFGVFLEHVSIDGSYLLQAARQVNIVKRTLIPVPKRVRLAEDQKTGDDAAKNNYRASGKFGTGGAEHEIGSTESTGDSRHLLSAAGVLESLAYETNWRATHGFHYHKSDFQVPEQSETGDVSGVKSAQENLDFKQLLTNMNMPAPEAVKVPVDHRYGDVDYVQRTAFISLLPDGGIAIGDGYGSQITMTAGHIRLDCPGDIHLAPGRNLVALGGDDIVLRARSSVDVTAGEKDLRLKAERNMQILAGNGGAGGVLIESKATSRANAYENLTGEDVVSSGVAIRTGKTDFNVWASNVYVRTGSDGSSTLSNGNITLDAGKGRSSVIVKGGDMLAYVRSQFSIYIGPTLDNSNVRRAHLFGNSVFLDAPTTVHGNFFATGSGSFGGSLASVGGIATATEQTTLGQLQGNSAARLREAVSNVTISAQDIRQLGGTVHAGIFSDGLYAEGQAGNDSLIDQASFSFRDDGAGLQYSTVLFEFPESRWQMMARLGLASGGSAWSEPVVTYQGAQQLPYPGKAAWDGKTLVRVKQLVLTDAGGNAKDRGTDGGPYIDSPELENDPGTPGNDYLVNA